MSDIIKKRVYNSNEERLAHIQEINDAKKLKEAEKERPFGGDRLSKRSCYNCAFKQGVEKCSNSAVTLNNHGNIINADLRGNTGLCGPDGLFFEKKPIHIPEWVFVAIGCIILAAISAGIVGIMVFAGMPLLLAVLMYIFVAAIIVINAD